MLGDIGSAEDVLRRLTPAERVVVVLHDVFAMPFDEVAATVGRTSQACRQLARRARQHDLAGVIILNMDAELIQAVQVIGDPRTLSFRQSQMARNNLADLHTPVVSATYPCTSSKRCTPQYRRRNVLLSPELDQSGASR